MAATTLSEQEEKKVKDFIHIVAERDSNNSSVPWKIAVKFLMARKFDVNRAVSLYMQHETIRAQEGIAEVNPLDALVKQELLSEKFTILNGRDSLGAAIALFTARNHYPHLSNHQATLKGLVLQLDASLESIETQRNGLVFIYDMTSAKYSNFDYELSIKILNMLKGGYPARLKKVLIVTAPLWFKASFKVMRLFVREKLRDRVFTVNKEQLISNNHIPKQSLPLRLGGNVDVNHREWISKCLLFLWGKNENSESDIAAYMNNHNEMPRELSVSSYPSTPSPDGSSSFTDSECSHQGIVSEKHNHEYSEKELHQQHHHDSNSLIDNNTMDISNNISSHKCNSIVVLDKMKTISCTNKRSSDTSPSEIVSADENLPSLPRKKIRDLEESIHVAESSGYNIKDFMEYTRIKGRRGLIREYEEIKAEPPTGSFEASKSRPNLPKSRYTDVLCLDHSRVKLSIVENDPYSDFINANYVDGYKHKAAYISTQGPLPRTFEDFWRMVWEQAVLLIVMATRTVERSRIKCGQYWPTEDEMSEEFGDYIVINNGASKKENYILTSLILHNTKTNEMREISHFQFVSWPDYGVPHSAEAFLDFMFHVREKQAERVNELVHKWEGHPDGPPITIHCSAGIGRTGTFVAVDVLTRRLADVGMVDVKKTVHHIRSQRAFSIQMPDQYVFIHLAIIEHAQRQGLITNIRLDGFEDSSSGSTSETDA